MGLILERPGKVNSWESVTVMVASNLAIIFLAFWNFRVQLEHRLTYLETQLQTIMEHLGIKNETQGS